MKQQPGKLSRRHLFAGAGTAGAVAAVASVLPLSREAALPVAETKAPPAKGGGYSVTEHVKQYYKTTLV
ncbi:MAG: formate dehydrogenase [Pseudomonadota bacterium]